MSEARVPYVSEFEYVPRLHPSRNPDCPSRFPGSRRIRDDFTSWHRPSIEVKAMLSPCSKFAEEKMFHVLDDRFDVRWKRSYEKKGDRGEKENCTRKIFISMKFNNIGKTETQEKFVVIDHALDSTTMRKIPLRRPYVIKIRQETVLQMYGLKFQSRSFIRRRWRYQRRSQNLADKRIDRATLNKVVNAEAREEVINNQSPNYMGCYVDSESPTCGQTFLRGEPIPFSQGFCCSCEPRVNDRRRFGGSNDSFGSFEAGAKSNDSDGTNKPRNRLRTVIEYTSLDDNRMAQRQRGGKEGGSKERKSNTNANPDRSRTIGSGAFASDTCQGRDAENKPIDGSQPKESSGNKETEKSNEFLLPRTIEPSGSSATNSIVWEKYSRKLADVSSTSVSPLSPEVVAGKLPGGDKIASTVDVAGDRASGRNDVPEKKTERIEGTARKRNREQNAGEQKDRFDQEQSASREETEADSRDFNFKIEDNRLEPFDAKGGSDREFHLMSLTIEKFPRQEDAKVTRGKDSSIIEEVKGRTSESPGVTRLRDSLGSTTYAAAKKLATGKRLGKATSWEDASGRKRKGCGKCWQVEPSEGNEGPPLKSSKKRNKAIPTASAIDSLAIQRAMHLNESLKNLSTGVSNRNRSLARWEGSRRGNLNIVMESTSPLPDIIVKSFNEKQGADGYSRSNDNKGNKISTGAVEKDRLLSNSLVSERNALLKNEKKLLTERIIKNYTPQKRTLKDLSYGKSYKLRDLRKRDSDSRESGTNFRRSRRHLRFRKGGRFKRRGSKRFDDSFSRRGRRKRAKEEDEDKGIASRNRNPGRAIRVYLDSSRVLKGRGNDESRSSKLATSETPAVAGKEGQKKEEEEEEEEEEGKGDSMRRNEANRQDSVDKQIEEKFSRISDALKEDAMGLKAISKETRVETGNDQANEIEKNFHDDAESQDKFNQPSDVSSRQRNKENPGETNEPADTGLGEKPEEFNEKDPFSSSDRAIKKGNELEANEDIYSKPRKVEEADERLFASQRNDPSASSSDGLTDKSSSTSNSDLVISSTTGSSINEQFRAPSSFVAAQEIEKAKLNDWVGDDGSVMNAPQWTAAEVSTDETQALIVIDVFKVANGSVERLTTVPKGLSRADDLPRLVYKAERSKKTAEKPSRQSSEFRPVHRTAQPVESTTLLVTESTVTTESPPTAENTTATCTRTTLITDETFRVSIVPASETPLFGGAEFHKEISIDETTFPDETDAPSTTDLATGPPERFAGLESISGNTVAMEGKKRLRMGFPGRKKKRTTPSMIKSKDLSVYRGSEARRDDRSSYSGNPGDYGRKKDSTRADSTMKFSLEAGNVDLAKRMMGVTSSYFREERKYLRLRVDGQGDRPSEKDAKYSSGNYESQRKFQRDEPRVEGEAQQDSEDVGTGGASSASAVGRVHRHSFSSGKEKSRSSNRGTEDVPGRILPPCARNRGRRIEEDDGCEEKASQRGRRLLSVQSFKAIKSVAGHRSSKDRKKMRENEENFVKDQDSDVEYEESAAEHRKRLKSVRDKDREKSKKRDSQRSALKRKKKEKSRSKKQSISSSKDSSRDYDYLLPKDQEYEEDETPLDERQVVVSNNPEEFLENYEAVPGLEDASAGSKISEDPRDDNFYDLSIDDSVSPDFEKFAENLREESEAATIGAERSISEEDRSEKAQGLGKDFEISLTGKIHLESDSNGRPVSISFDAGPEFFRKDSVGDGKASGYGNRFPSESANSFIDASDTLVPGGTDNANFLPLNVFDVPPLLNAPLDSVDEADRSNAKEYYSGPTRARTRNAEPYRVDSPDSHRQRLLRLQKKSIESSGELSKREIKSSQDLSEVNGPRGGGSGGGDSNGNSNRSKKNCETSSLERNGDLLPEEAKVEGELSDIDQDESLSIVDRSRALSSSNENGLKRTPSESAEGSPQIAIDLSNLPDNSPANEETLDRENAWEVASNIAAESNSGSANATNITAQEFDVTKPTTSREKSDDDTGATIVTYERTDATSSTESTVTEQRDRVTTTTTYEISTETMAEMTLRYLSYAEGFQSENASQYDTSGKESKESIEKKNMLAVAEFVKKLENLVSDVGNSSNKTGHTLIHLKKFIIVPDNRTLWSVKEFAEPGTVKRTTSAEEIVVMGEGKGSDEARKSSSRFDEEAERSEDEVGAKSKVDDSSLIKEIISSVLRGDDLKRDVTPKKSAESDEGKCSSKEAIDVKAPDGLEESGFKDWIGKQELGTHLDAEEKFENSVKQQEEASTKRDCPVQNVEKHTGDRFSETKEAKEPSSNDNVVCSENKSNVKGKREATSSNANSVTRKGRNKSHDKRKDARHAKKKRRKKRKRKMKKRKGDRNRKSNKKAGGKWPFKRNLLMLSEKEQAETTGENYDAHWRADKFLRSEENKRKIRLSKKPKGEDKSKEPQIRGGQNCADYRHPSNVDPLKYMESTHCLRFSNLWYSVYKLEEPTIDHKVHVEIYEKRSSIDDSIPWKDLTNGSAIRLGTFDRYYRNKEDTVSLEYSDIKLMPNTEFNLDAAKDRLLVPSTLTGERSKYPEVEGWSSEFLVVQANKINEDANECDKAGVGFTAFVGQPDRCGRVRGTCLKNQPLAYWRHDMRLSRTVISLGGSTANGSRIFPDFLEHFRKLEARESGRAGCYFLSNFAWVPSEAIKYNANGTGSREFLALQYHSLHVSVIDVELRADYNALLGAGSSGRLTEVDADNTAIDYTLITLLITNRGSFAASYRARITDCPKGLPVSWQTAETPTKIISPHRDRKITLDLYGSLSLDEFSCSAELVNRDGEPVARRQIKVRRMDRCVCANHCECSCTNDDRGTSCQPMSLENYRAAGFRGPIPTTPVESPLWSDVIAIVVLFFTALLFLLLFLGFLKWLIGLCVPAVGRWGLEVLHTDRISEYLEKDLKSRPVVFDQLGTPVHPDTGRRTVRVCNRKLEFFLNVIFFFLYPFAVCHWFCEKSRSPEQPASTNESKTSPKSEDDEPPTMVCLSTYGDSVNSKMEEEDTRYVIDELKKSQESLQNRSRYKRNRRILGEDSSSD